MWSSCSRFRLAFAASSRCPRDAPLPFGPAPVRPKPLVAITSSSRGSPRLRIACPVSSSDAALGIDVGGVDEVDAGVEGRVDQPLRLRLPEAADLAPDLALPAEGHRAEAELGDIEAGAAEGLVAHAVILPFRGRRARRRRISIWRAGRAER